MKFRIIALFIVFTLLILFYPGESYFFSFFAKNKEAIQQTPAVEVIPTIAPVPSVLNNYPLDISAEGVYIVDLDTYTPLFEKNIHERLFPASTTKIITALVANDVFKPDQIITVHNVEVIGQVMGLQEGERITVENLLYGILIHSGNDAAYALANAYGFDKFIALMNKKAQSLGMKDTYFKNPAGLDDPQQTTTPFDLALASRELLKHQNLQRIVSIKEIIISDVDFKIFHTLSNVNKLLGEIQGIGGLKTGETDAAGENLVSFYKNNGHSFLIVILKSQDRFADTTTVVKWIIDNVTYSTVSLGK